MGNLFKNIGKAFGSLFGKKHKAKIANHAMELGIAGEGSSKKAEESVTGQASVGGQNTDNSKVPYVVIVLQNPDGANIGYPQGHTALLIGNYDEGFTYISKNGAVGSVGSSGEPDVVNLPKEYSSLTDFTNRNDDGNVYKDMLVYYTTKDVAEKVLAGALGGLYKKYNVISCNCVGTVLDGLYRAGLTNIHPNAQNTHQPNRIFLELVNQKKGEYFNIRR